MANEGAEVVVCDVSKQLPTIEYDLATKEDLFETKRLVEATGRRCLALEADVGEEGAMEAVVERAISEFGRVDILAANAGIASYASVWELSRAQWDEVVRVDLTGVFESCRAVVPHMIERKSGSIVCTSSMAGLKGIANAAHYVAAKHGVVGLVKALAIELAPYDIRVNALCPTNVRTPILENQAVFDLFDPEHGDRDAALSRMRNLHLLDTPWLKPEDVSRALLFLASDDAKWITGTALPVDAGWNTR